MNATTPDALDTTYAALVDAQLEVVMAKVALRKANRILRAAQKAYDAAGKAG